MPTHSAALFRSQALALAGWLVAAAAWCADEPAAGKPPWQRMLRGAEAKQAAALQQQTDALMGQGAFEDAVQPATQLWELRQ